MRETVFLINLIKLIQNVNILQNSLILSISQFSLFSQSKLFKNLCSCFYIFSHYIRLIQMTSKLKIGQQVIVNTKEIPQKKGVVRFVGKIEGKTDQYVGVELDEPAGKNNGDHEGKNYFKVQKKTDKGLYGVFVKPQSVKVVEGKKPATGAPVRPSKAPQPPPAAQGKTKLSNELFQQQNSEMQALKEQLQAAYEKIRSFEELDTVKEVESLRGKIKQLQQINRTLKLDVEKARYRSDSAGQERLKELGEKMAYFQNLKEAAEKDRADLRKKVAALESQLEEGAQTIVMFENLTSKYQILQEKYEKLRAENDSISAQLKSAVMLGSGSSSEQLEQNVTMLNEMVTMLEGELQEERQKVANFQKQMQNNAVRLNELVTLQRQLKSRNEQVQAMRQQLQALSDTATFAESLTMANMRKDEEIQQQAKRLKQFAQKVNKLQSEFAQSQEVVELQTLEMEDLEDEVARHAAEKEEKVKNIEQLTNQIQKYKQKIKELSQTHSSIQLIDDKDEQSLIKNYFNTDLYQHKYYQLSRLHQITQSRLLQHQLQSSTIKQYSGTLLANLFETLPQTFTSRFHPHLLNLLLSISSANYKLYLLFDTVSSALIHKSQLYTAENENLVGWMLMLLDQIPMLYGSLVKVEFAILSADGEEDLKDILSNSDLREQTVRVDIFAHELLQRFASETLDTQIGFDPFIESVEVFDKACEAVKRLPTELAIRLQLSVQGMRGVHQILSSIELYHRNSQARENAQVDTMLQNFLKLLQQYLRECCTNPHVRLKSQMRSYLSGIDFVVKILREIELNDTLQQLNSLYSDVEDIKILKETVLTTQFHLKQLTADLQQITYTTPLSRVHVKLPGKLWQQKIKQMKDELGRFQTTTAEKVELQRIGAQQKRKILILEKEIKDRQATKDLHQRRIGQLQLKVEQASLMEGEFRRQSDKLRNVQQERKIVEDQLNSQIKRKKQLEDQLKKTKQKFDLFQTESVMKQKKQKAGTSLSSEDLSNLSIFKSVVAEAGALKNHQIRRQLHELSFSPILAPKTKAIPHQNGRRQVLRSLAELKFGESTHHIESQLRSAEFKKKPIVFQQFSVGTLLLRSNKSELSVDINRREIVGY